MAVTEILASVDDINTHLPTDKLDAGATTPASVEDDINLYEIDAARFIRSMLSGTFTAVQLATWVSPAATPELIRSVAGRLIAAKYYSVRYAEDSDTSNYAQQLYNQAVNIIMDIRNGSQVVVDITDTPIDVIGAGFTADDFYPNDSAPGPVFTMAKDFA